MEVSGHVLVC